MKPGRMAEAQWAAKDRGPREMRLSRLEDDRLVEGAALKLRILADEYAQEHRVVWEIHEFASLELPLVDGGELWPPLEGQSFDGIPDLRQVPNSG